MPTNSTPVTSLLEKYGFAWDTISRLFEFHSNCVAPSFAYPWIELEHHLGSQREDSIYLVGYGSLLNPASASRSIRDTPAEGHAPVVTMGARRIFNYQIPQSVFERYQEFPSSNDRAALNAEPMSSALMNGRLIEMQIDDLPALRVREKAYDLQPVSCIYWHDRASRPFLAYALCCPYETFEGERYVDNSLVPFKPYYELCCEGARMVSAEFLNFFLETTFLADRVTTLRDVERPSGAGST